MPTLTNSDSLSSPPPLVCYWNNFYEWCETHYRELPPDLLRIRLTRFLKTEGLSRLPQRLVENAIACIKAECLLEGDRPLPFYIEFGEDGCLEHRKYLGHEQRHHRHWAIRARNHTDTHSSYPELDKHDCAAILL